MLTMTTPGNKLMHPIWVSSSSYRFKLLTFSIFLPGRSRVILTFKVIHLIPLITLVVYKVIGYVITLLCFFTFGVEPRITPIPSPPGGRHPH